MSYDDSDWDVAIGEPQTASFSLSRFLEYTDADLEKQFTPVSASKLAFLEQFPCLFMSELHTDEDGDREYVTLRVGRVSNLAVENGEINYSFVLEKDFKRFFVDDRKTVVNALGMGKWELTRTHWAVKDGNLVDALRKLGLELNAGTQQAAVAAPPPDEQPAELTATSLEEFLSIVMAQHIPGEDEVFYRGHSDKERYKLEPSLLRKTKTGDFRYLFSEANLVRELLTAHPGEFSGDQYTIDKLVRMQHYGLPTRLLDVTSNPLVALYFCCSSLKIESGKEVEGEVIILTTKKSDVKFYDSDTVSCIANLALLSDEHKATMDTNLSLEEFNETTECQHLLHNIRAEKPYFKEKIVPKDLEKIVFVRGRNSNSRITSQSGAFLLFGRDAILPETGHSSLNVRRITVRNKEAILAQLEKLNIKSSTIYPGIEKTASEIAKKYERLG